MVGENIDDGFSPIPVKAPDRLAVENFVSQFQCRSTEMQAQANVNGTFVNKRLVCLRDVKFALPGLPFDSCGYVTDVDFEI